MILRGAGRFLVVQCPGLGPPTSKAQAHHPTRVQRPWQPQGSEEKEERKKKKKNNNKKRNKKTDRQNPRTNDKSKRIQTKSHKETYSYTLTKREKGEKDIYLY